MLKASHERYSHLLPKNISFEEDIEVARRSLAAMGSLSDLSEWTDTHTHTLLMGEDQRHSRPYHMLINRPQSDDPNKVVVVGGEFGNGLTPAVAARARVIRDVVAPEATLVVQPNSTLLEADHMNYSREERRNLVGGSNRPLVERIARTLDGLNNPEDMTMFGPSQGGTVVLGYAAHFVAPEGIAVSVLEAPNVVKRSSAKLLKDFAGSGAELKDIIGENFEHPEDPLQKDIVATLGLLGFARFGLGLATRRNRSLRGIMRDDQAHAHMAGVLSRGGSVVHAWGDVNNVSPSLANEAIRHDLRNFPLYRSVELRGSDHSVTNNYALCGALAKSARRLLLDSRAE